jgi:hypothetical protein
MDIKIWRIQLQFYNISKFLTEQRDFLQLKPFRPMGRKGESSSNPIHDTLSQFRRPSHRRGTALCRIPRNRLQGFGDYLLHLSIGDVPGSSQTELIQQAMQTTCNKAGPSFPHSDSSYGKRGGHIAILLVFRTLRTRRARKGNA